MITINGIYENGEIILEKEIKSEKKLNVVVTFLEENIKIKPKRLRVKDFSFLKSREKSLGYTGSLSDSVIDERRSEL